MYIMAGKEPYGRVKVVGGTPIVTTFTVFQLLPLYPLQSYYVHGAAEDETHDIPFVGSVRTASVPGYPLAKIDRLSVTMSYFRAACGIILFPCFLLIVVFVAMGGRNPAGFEKVGFIQWPVGAFIVIVTALLLSYWLPPINPRDRDIRLRCGEILEACIDPAKVDPVFVAFIEDLCDATTALEEAQKGNDSRQILIGKLIQCRCEIARGTEQESMERFTDDLLIQIARLKS